MIRDELYKSFKDFLYIKDIKVLESEISELKTIININEEELLNQLFIISEFHKKTMGYKGYMGLRLDNKTGSQLEQYKVNTKRLKRYLKNIRINSASSDFERKLLKIGFEYLKRCDSCISEIMNAGYMDLIERSMKRTEICIVNPNFSNLSKNDNIIEIGSLNKCSYNNVEMDCFYLLSKFRKRNISLDYKALVKKFCEYEDLNENSLRFILALLSYPSEFIRCSNRYREKSKDWSEEEYGERLNTAILKDGEVLF
ncbi:spore coat protein [Candidatus Clostridium radicumherbarum]|uniref:Spore coat protein n=1 Tax=Candidatus Clostridium radicumherbarum TaxID=3381662 RepID=A0ABW8TN73_9CLOT